jgi:hypothetical protein
VQPPSNRLQATQITIGEAMMLIAGIALTCWHLIFSLVPALALLFVARRRFNLSSQETLSWLLKCIVLWLIVGLVV